MNTMLKPDSEIADAILRQIAESDAGLGRVRAEGHMVQVLQGVRMACSSSGFDRILRLAIARSETSPLLNEEHRPWVKRHLASQLGTTALDQMETMGWVAPVVRRPSAVLALS
jgi:hypothetical protein